MVYLETYLLLESKSKKAKSNKEKIEQEILGPPSNAIFSTTAYYVNGNTHV